MSNNDREPLDLSEMMTTDEVANRLEIAASTLLSWRNNRQNLAFYRIGRRVLYKRADVEAYMTGSRVEPKPVTGVRVEAAND